MLSARYEAAPCSPSRRIQRTSNDVKSEGNSQRLWSGGLVCPSTDLDEVAVQTRERVGMSQAHQGVRRRLRSLQQVIQEPSRRLPRRPAGRRRLLRCTDLALRSCTTRSQLTTCKTRRVTRATEDQMQLRMWTWSTLYSSPSDCAKEPLARIAVGVSTSGARRPSFSSRRPSPYGITTIQSVL